MGETDERYRQEVRKFLADNLPAGFRGVGSLPDGEVHAFVEGWRKRLADHGYLAVHWPVAYGGAGLSTREAVIVAEELTRAGAPLGLPTDGFGIRLLGNTLLRWGTEAQKAHYLPRILSGEDRWCQGFSEPNAGSDLANLCTRAALDGDEWVVTGQKIWTSVGHVADHIFVLCRTDPSAAPPRKGLSMLLLDMRQPGVEVRPIRMMSGGFEFNEVFLTDARAPRYDVVGDVGEGWAVAMTMLGFERGESTATEVIRFEAEWHRLLELAQRYGRFDDPVVRQRLARCYTTVQIMRYLGAQALARVLAGGEPGADASLGKLLWSEHHQTLTELAMDVMGLDGLAPTGSPPLSVFGPDSPGADSTMSWAMTFLNARAGTIYAGTNQVQRNIVGERVLGLPKEP